MSRMIARLGLAVITAAVVGSTEVPAHRIDPAPRLSGGVRTHVVVAKESLRSIGSRAGIDPRTIAHDNGLPLNAVVEIGTALRLDNRHITPAQLVHGTIVVNVPQRMLFFANEEETLAAPVAVGSAGWPTPLGPFSIREKELNPTWDVPASIAAEARDQGKPLPARVPPGPSNPLGRHYLALSVGSVGIHGTNAPTSIYQARTHGCIRMHPDDVAVLFERVAVGTSGMVVYEPVLLAMQEGEVFLEVHPDVYRKGPPPLAVAHQLAEELSIAHLVDWTLVARLAGERHGIARPVTRR